MDRGALGRKDAPGGRKAARGRPYGLGGRPLGGGVVGGEGCARLGPSHDRCGPPDWRYGPVALAFRVSAMPMPEPPQDEPPASELDALVARTDGPQWWRKAFHAINATLVATAIVLFDWSDGTLLLVLGAGVLVLFALDLARLSNRALNTAFFRAFGKLASPREAIGIASSTWYALGIFLAVALFPRAEAVAGILVLGYADPAAAFVGRTLGRRPFLGGTLEGSAAFFLTSAAVLAFQFSWPAVLVAAAAAAFAERRSWPLDDNLTVPIVCAGALFGVGLLLG